MRTVYYPPGGGDPLYSLPSSWGNVAGITLENCEELGWFIDEEETPLEIREIEYTAAVDSLLSTTAVDRGYASTEQLLSFANSTVPKQWVDAHDFIAWRDAVLAALAEFIAACQNMTIYPWPDYGEMLSTLPGFSWSDGPYVIPENETVPGPVDSAVAMHHLSSQDAPSRGFYTSTELTVYGHSIKDYQNSSPWRRATMGPYEWPWEPPYMLGLAEDGEAVTVSDPVIGFARITDREDALDLAFQICLPLMPATYPSLEGTGTPIEGEYVNAPAYIWRLIEVDLWGNYSFPEEHAPSTRLLRTMYEDSEYYTGTDDYLVWADRILGKWVLCQIGIMTAEEWTGYDNYEGQPPWPDCDPGPFPRYSFEQIASNKYAETVLGFFPPYFNNLEQFSSDYNQDPDNPSSRNINWSVSGGVATARASIGTSAWRQLSGGSSTVPVTAFYEAVADEDKHPWVSRWTQRLPSGTSTALVDLVPPVASRLGKLASERLYQRDGIPLRIAVPPGSTGVKVSSVDVIPTTSSWSPSMVSLGAGVSVLAYETTVHASTAFGETSGLAFLRYYNAAGGRVDTLQEASYLTFSLDEVNPLSDTIYVQWQDEDLDWGEWKPVSVHDSATAAGEPVSGEYTAGTGISINGTVIALDTTGAVTGYVLRKAADGVEWSEVSTVTTESVQGALSIDPDIGDATKVLTEKGTFVSLPSEGPTYTEGTGIDITAGVIGIDTTGASTGQVLKKTADGVAWGTDEAGDTLPAVTTSDNGDVLTVVAGVWAKADPPSGGTSYTEGAGIDITEGVIAIDTAGASTGQVLKKTVGGVGWADDETGSGSLPAVTTDDNGDVLSVVAGEWAKADAPVSATTANVQTALSINTSTGSEAKVLSEKGSFVNLPSGGGGGGLTQDQIITLIMAVG